MKLNKLSTAILAAGLMAFGAANAVPSITLNPSALNGGLAGSALQIDTATGGQFGPTVVTSIQTRLDSFLNISSTAGAGTWTETGALIFSTYNSATFLGGNRALGGGQYDIYGLFSGAGGGTWTGNQFNVGSITSFTIDIWASPEVGTALSLATGGVVTQGNKDFLLGTATFSGSFGGTNAQLGLNGVASTQLTAEFAFSPANLAYTGAGGYFMAPDPFVVSFNGSGSSNSGQSTYAVNPDGSVVITTGNGATGNLTPLAQRIPEPGALALVSLALVAGGLVTARKRAPTA